MMIGSCMMLMDGVCKYIYCDYANDVISLMIACDRTFLYFE